MTALFLAIVGFGCIFGGYVVEAIKNIGSGSDQGYDRQRDQVLVSGNEQADLVAAARSRLRVIPNFRALEFCPNCGGFDCHWIDKVQSKHVMRKCRSCGNRWRESK